MGDINSIMEADEKQGGRQHRLSRSIDFVGCMEDCNMMDSGFSGDKFTWTNARRLRGRVLMRLDRVMYNDLWSQSFSIVNIRHLPRTGSECGNMDPPKTKYFKFLNFWIDQDDLMNIVRNSWQIVVRGNPMWIMQQKLKRLSNYLSQWSKNHIGNIFDKMKDLENQPDQPNEFKILENIDSILTNEDNESLVAVPSMDETFQAIILLDPDSAPGPDGFNGRFYQATWDVIKEDVHNMVKDFFRGGKLTKFFTHTCLILLPKVESPSNFSQMRPISLSNFSNKIISKIISNRLTNLLPKLISQNQTGFIKCRLITENVLLTQELVQDIKKNNKYGNIVMKLDWIKPMTKFLGSFSNLLSDIWDFLKGLKQGDPLSPGLFVLAAETLSKALNQLHNKERSIKTITKILKQYEKESGQEINIEKSVFLTATNSPEDRRRMIGRITGYKHQCFPMKYLGCPIFPGRKRLSYFTDIAKSVMNKAQGWQGNILSSGGRATIIKHVLQSQTLHTLAAMSPPKGIIKQLEKYFADFFWGQTDNKKRYHWSSWANMCYTQAERGTGFKSIVDICKVFASKIWWRLRVENNIWSQFMMAKYSQRGHVVARNVQGYQSFIWKELLRIKSDAEPHILWKINEAKMSFWLDNWTGLSPLAVYHHSGSNPGTLMVAHCLVADSWDMEYIAKLVPPEICNVIQKMDIGQRDKTDQAIWMDNPSGKFACASAFQALRKRLPESPIWKCIWNKGNPFKMAFISWRIIKKKMPMYDRIKNFSNDSDPMCICCNDPKEETILHVFIEEELATKLWKPWSSIKYGNKKYSEAKICYEVAQHVKGIINKKGYNIDLSDNWSRICSSMEAHKTVLTSFPVVWSKPPENIIKINNDGSSMVHYNKA
ncbi:uncharacterized protein LOC132031564 [Lycium ferocissimum]|uniref:uncharacterized protein LOC132031564 n=1 Tax=Lycium ferocissimum TaxID=112874 RepID=UPI0028158AD6|nr:uncharacterized protein LOC132031564 [Lycium ferocissimum]